MENCESVPDREHLAKIAKISGYGLDDFVAYLEGKQPQTPTKLGHLKQQVKDLRIGELMEIYRAVGERITELSIGERVGSR